MVAIGPAHADGRLGYDLLEGADLGAVHVFEFVHIDKHALGKMDEGILIVWVDGAGEDVVG